MSTFRRTRAWFQRDRIERLRQRAARYRHLLEQVERELDWIYDGGHAEEGVDWLPGRKIIHNNVIPLKKKT